MSFFCSIRSRKQHNGEDGGDRTEPGERRAGCGQFRLERGRDGSFGCHQILSCLLGRHGLLYQLNSRKPQLLPWPRRIHQCLFL